MSKSIEVKNAKRFLLGFGNYTITDTGTLTMIDLARHGDFYIPQGVKKIAVDIFFNEESNYSPLSMKAHKMVFDSDEEIFIGDVGLFKPEKGKKYEILPITIDLRGKSFEETRKLVEQLGRFSMTVKLDATYIFDEGREFEEQLKAVLVAIAVLEEQLTAVLGAVNIFEGMGFSCFEGETPRAFIGKNNITNCFNQRLWVRSFIASLKQISHVAYTEVVSRLYGIGWIFTDGVAFENVNM